MGVPISTPSSSDMNLLHFHSHVCSRLHTVLVCSH